MLLFLLFVILWGVLLLNVKEQHMKQQMVWISMGLIWLYWGFSYTNAADTGGYMGFFDMLHTNGWVLDSLYGSSAGNMEPGTFILMQLCKKISDSYYFFQAVILLIDMCLSYCGLRKLLGNNEQPLLFFLLFTFHTTIYLSAMRQGVAIAIMIFCLPLFRDNKFWIYIPLLLLAIFFHQSAILLFAIPVVMLLIKIVKIGGIVGRTSLLIIFAICNICHLFEINAASLIENVLGDFVYDSSLSTSRELTIGDSMKESSFGFLKVLEMDTIYLIFFFSNKGWKTDNLNYLAAFFFAYFGLNMLVGGIVIHRLTYYLEIPYYFIVFESLRYLLKNKLKFGLSLSNSLIYIYMFALFVVQSLSGGNYIFKYQLIELF